MCRLPDPNRSAKRSTEPGLKGSGMYVSLKVVLGKVLIYVCYFLAAYFTRAYLLPKINDHMKVHREVSGDSDFVSFPKGKLLAHVGGCASAKEDLYYGIVLPMKRPDAFFGSNTVSTPQFFLLHGPPGTGKTMLATSAAAEAGVPLLSLNASNLESKWYGETPRILDKVFKSAREKHSPCVIFFDEIDSLGRRRSEMDCTSSYTLKCELLRNMDTLKGLPVCVVACTNCPGSLDPALRRRFVKELSVGLPDEDERMSILEAITSDEGWRKKRKKHVLKEVSRMTAGYSGSDLASLYESVKAERVKANLDIVLSHGSSNVLPPLSLGKWEEIIQKGKK